MGKLNNFYVFHDDPTAIVYADESAWKQFSAMRAFDALGNRLGMFKGHWYSMVVQPTDRRGIIMVSLLR